MSRRTMRMAVLALACVLAGRLAVADAGPGPQRKPEPVQIAYPVADLVVPIDQDAAPNATCEMQLMERIRKTVSPASWQDHGGSGSMQYYPMGMALVVRQSPAVQRQVAELIRALRREQDVEVCVELHMVEVPEALAAEFRKHAGFARSKADGKAPVETAFLSDKELYPWMRLFQTDPATNIVMAPKMTVFSGQQAHITVGAPAGVANQAATEAGTRCDVLPTISADHRFVHLKLGFYFWHKSAVGSAQPPPMEVLTLQHACAIPDGGTMAVPLGAIMTEGRCESEACVLSKIPYVNRLVHNVGYSRAQRTVFLLVTPRIIVNEEEELPFYSELPPLPRVPQP